MTLTQGHITKVKVTVYTWQKFFQTITFHGSLRWGWCFTQLLSMTQGLLLPGVFVPVRTCLVVFYPACLLLIFKTIYNTVYQEFYRVGLIFAEFTASLKSLKIDTAKNKPYYTSSLRVLVISKKGLGENLSHLPSGIFVKIFRCTKFLTYRRNFISNLPDTHSTGFSQSLKTPWILGFPWKWICPWKVLEFRWPDLKFKLAVLEFFVLCILNWNFEWIHGYSELKGTRASFSKKKIGLLGSLQLTS